MKDSHGKELAAQSCTVRSANMKCRKRTDELTIKYQTDMTLQDSKLVSHYEQLMDQKDSIIRSQQEKFASLEQEYAVLLEENQVITTHRIVC